MVWRLLTAAFGLCAAGLGGAPGTSAAAFFEAVRIGEPPAVCLTDDRHHLGHTWTILRPVTRHHAERHKASHSLGEHHRARHPREMTDGFSPARRLSTYGHSGRGRMAPLYGAPAAPGVPRPYLVEDFAFEPWAFPPSRNLNTSRSVYRPRIGLGY